MYINYEELIRRLRVQSRIMSFRLLGLPAMSLFLQYAKQTLKSTLLKRAIPFECVS